MNKTLIGIKDSIMYKIAQFAFFLLTIILLGGGIYSWSTLKEMETKLPITSLEQHNNIKTMIDGLVRLSNSLVLLKDKIDDESIRETTLINLDICFNLHKNFEKTIPELNHEKYVVVLNEINYVMNSMDGYLNNEESLSEVEVKTLYTRLDEIIIELNSVYLDTNQQVVNVLMIQSKQIEFLKFTLTIVFMIIALSAGIIGLLAFLQKTVIKELNQKEEELTEARKLADKANEAKSSFLANMSHEIRTPMNAIIGINELLKRTTLNRKQLDYTSKMETSAKNLLSLINDILDFSKIEAGKLDLEIIDFNLEEVLDNVSNIIGSKAFEKGLEFVIDKDFQIPLNLKGDPLRLQQVLINLVNNAIKFTEEGEVVIKVKCEELDNTNIKLTFEINDTGIGMTPEQNSKLFKSFSQADISTTRKYGGTGLGLAISKNIIELFGGTIDVISEYGKGSSFYFTVNFELGIINEKNNIIPEILKDMKVLVVDDNMSAIKVMENYLCCFGMKPILAKSGIESVDLVDSDIKLIFMDWKLSDLSGLEAWKQIKIKLNNNLPKIIMVAANEKEDILYETKKEGIDSVITKPISQSVLFNNIVQVFSSKIQAESQHKNHYFKANLSDIRGANILVVEDNEINQQIVKEVLELEGFFVNIADNGRIAINKITQNKYDIVLMDLQMPVLDGYSATEEIRTNKNYDTLPIIALSADAMFGTKDKVMKSGMNDYITKPIIQKELFDTLLKWIKPAKREIFEPVENTEDDEKEKELYEKLHSFNVKDSLMRLSGNIKLLIIILNKFEKSNKNFNTHIKNLIENNELEVAARELHTLKGVAANLGEEKIKQLAIQLEYELKDGVNILESSSFKELEVEISKAIEEVCSLNNTPETIQKTILNKNMLLIKLLELKNQLENYDANSIDTFSSISYSLKSLNYLEDTLKLDKMIKEYNFEEALDICNRMCDLMTNHE